jgi:hypothetical protein
MKPLREPRARHERRRAKRIKVLGQIRACLLGGELPLSMVDISASGFAVQSPIDFEPGFEYEFKLTSERGAEVFVVASNVHCLHVVEDGKAWFMAGFTFPQNLKTEDRQRIAALIRALIHRPVAADMVAG